MSVGRSHARLPDFARPVQISLRANKCHDVAHIDLRPWLTGTSCPGASMHARRRHGCVAEPIDNLPQCPAAVARSYVHVDDLTRTERMTCSPSISGRSAKQPQRLLPRPASRSHRLLAACISAELYVFAVPRIRSTTAHDRFGARFRSLCGRRLRHLIRAYLNFR